MNCPGKSPPSLFLHNVSDRQMLAAIGVVPVGEGTDEQDDQSSACDTGNSQVQTSRMFGERPENHSEDRHQNHERDQQVRTPDPEAVKQNSVFETEPVKNSVTVQQYRSPNQRTLDTGNAFRFDDSIFFEKIFPAAEQ